MNAPEQVVARKIARILDQGVRELDRNAAERLALAREQALAGLRDSPVLEPAWSGARPSGSTGWERSSGYLIPMAVLILGLVGIVYWQSGSGSSSELADIDARLLTDDLPIDAYLDKGFDSWLKRQ